MFLAMKKLFPFGPKFYKFWGVQKKMQGGVNSIAW